MRSLALIPGGLLLLAAQQTSVPAPLAKDFATLAAAPSLNVVYNLRVIGEAPSQYKLALTRPGMFRLTTPTGFVVSDGKTVTTYKASTKTYTEETYDEAWAIAFAKRPEVVGWGAYLLKEPAADLAGAKVGAARTILTNPTTEVEVTPKKGTPVTLYLDNKLGIARGWLIKSENKETLVTATTIEIGKAPLAADTFAFVAPDGAKKEEVAATVTFAQVSALLQDRCLPCHGGGQPRAGIGLTTYEGVMGIVKAGDPAGSLLVRSVKGDGVKKMPLGNKTPLSEAEIKMLSDWIAAGAKQ